MKTLKDVKVGETVTVAKLHGEGPVKRRIMDMGITKGVEKHIVKTNHNFVYIANYRACNSNILINFSWVNINM